MFMLRKNASRRGRSPGTPCPLMRAERTLAADARPLRPRTAPRPGPGPGAPPGRARRTGRGASARGVRRRVSEPRDRPRLRSFRDRVLQVVRRPPRAPGRVARRRGELDRQPGPVRHQPAAGPGGAPEVLRPPGPPARRPPEFVPLRPRSPGRIEGGQDSRDLSRPGAAAPIVDRGLGHVGLGPRPGDRRHPRRNRRAGRGRGRSPDRGYPGLRRGWPIALAPREAGQGDRGSRPSRPGPLAPGLPRPAGRPGRAAVPPAPAQASLSFRPPGRAALRRGLLARRDRGGAAPLSLGRLPAPAKAPGGGPSAPRSSAPGRSLPTASGRCSSGGSGQPGCRPGSAPTASA